MVGCDLLSLFRGNSFVYLSTGMRLYQVYIITDVCNIIMTNVYQIRMTDFRPGFLKLSALSGGEHAGAPSKQIYFSRQSRSEDLNGLCIRFGRTAIIEFWRTLELQSRVATHTDCGVSH